MSDQFEEIRKFAVEWMANQQVKLTTGSEAGYYWAKIPYRKSILRNRKQERQIAAVASWCFEQFGPECDPETQQMRWWYVNEKFMFANEDDRLLFVLRWQ